MGRDYKHGPMSTTGPSGVGETLTATARIYSVWKTNHSGERRWSTPAR
jgi:hypothetical protein